MNFSMELEMENMITSRQETKGNGKRSHNLLGLNSIFYVFHIDFRR